MIKFSSYETFAGLTIDQAVNATTLYQGLLEEKGRYLTLDKLTGKTDEDILQTILDLNLRGHLKIANPDVNLEDVEGIEVESIQLRVKLRTFDDPMPSKDQGSLDFKNAARIESGTDEFRIGYATYRGIVTKLDFPDDPLTPYQLTIGRITIFEPEVSPSADRFRYAGKWAFSTIDGAWSHFDEFKGKRQDGKEGINDQFMLPETGAFHGVRIYVGPDGFDGVSEILELTNPEFPSPNFLVVESEDELGDEDAAYRFWEAYLDRVAPSEELPEGFRLGVISERFSGLEVFETTPESEDDKPAEVPVFEFDVTAGETSYSVGVYHGENPRIEATYYDDKSEKQVRTVGAKLSEVKTESLSKKFAEKHLAD